MPVQDPPKRRIRQKQRCGKYLVVCFSANESGLEREPGGVERNATRTSDSLNRAREDHPALARKNVSGSPNRRCAVPTLLPKEGEWVPPRLRTSEIAFSSKGRGAWSQPATPSGVWRVWLSGSWFLVGRGTPIVP